MDDDLIRLGEFIKYYTLIKGQKGAYAVLSKDINGLTYVGRWIRTDLLVDIPEEKSWSEISNMEVK